MGAKEKNEKETKETIEARGYLMRYVIDGEVVEKEQTAESKTCDHQIKKQEIRDTVYRFCKHCNMLAHEDGSFWYCCGAEWCRCMQ